jgi:predicted nuclease of restriction endonuclease-like (RecB) superfamily
MINLYWHIGKTITQRQEVEGWGKSVVERLSKDLKDDFPNQAGFSSQNLWYMRQFYMTYRSLPILQQPVGEIPWGQPEELSKQLPSAKELKKYLKSKKK